MIRPIAILLFLVSALLAAVPAHALMDSVSTATDIVDGFYAEADSLVRTVPGAEEPFRKPALEGKEKALADIRSIGWTNEPSRRRYQQVREIVEDYTSGVVSGIEGLKTGLAPDSARRIDEITEQLTSLREFKLKALEETLAIEAYEKKGPKPVPLIDRERTPFDNPPDEAPGIWFR
ncbi:MAG: hypothetical protein Q8P48_03120 [Deltaproteobacteria bacterium]|nr:hypothetical protein [Deltaproteobacteria bacterium]